MEKDDLKTESNNANTVLPAVPYILCSAIWYRDLPTMAHLPKNVANGVVLCGWRHGNIIAQMSSLAGLRTVMQGTSAVGEYIQGFLTNDNRFVDRKEAGQIAFDSGQIDKLSTYLYSEDLW